MISPGFVRSGIPNARRSVHDPTAFSAGLLALRHPGAARSFPGVSQTPDGHGSGTSDEQVDFKRGRFGRTAVVITVVVGLVVVALAALAVTSGPYTKPSQQILREKEPIPVEPTDQKEGGCPCGCDRSVAMVSALALEPEDVSRETVQASLDTIFEREAAGYVTEAMVEHRLRLLGLTSGALRGVHDTPRALELRAARSRSRAVEDDTLRVRTDLVVHGEHTETVGERQKLLRACFVLWMELENLTGEELALTPPAIQARVPFPVSRWYLEGGDGAPWDGKLGAGAKRSLHVIGYLGDVVEPGAVVDATVRFGSLAIPASARARRRWDQVD